ncbi:MAG: hypothetical protein H6682_12815 [Candidatus Eisenbacteria bacterium]|nr:hypothetical protein [Candidatus Eisenbacteria bacterium]
MPTARHMPMDDFRDICFVIMPFGVKEVWLQGRKYNVDFDQIYERLFKPAISSVQLPAKEGGGHLRPVRADQEFHSGLIDLEMFHYLEYSRFALADITGLNANVFYELGARHRARESGTAIFRHCDAAIPFDINQVKAFPYTVDPDDRLESSRGIVAKVLTDSLARNAWDSPIRRALQLQRAEPAEVEDVLLAAENATREAEFEEAHKCWIRASELDTRNPLPDLRASDYPKKHGDWDLTIRLLRQCLNKEDALDGVLNGSTYAEAYRELGIAENRRDRATYPRAGEESLRKAIHFNPEDFDAWASLGGVLRRANDETGALEAYEESVRVSRGHPYPLLMALKLRAKTTGRWSLDAKTNAEVGEAKGFRLAQVTHDPPIDPPWSHFDLAECLLYLGHGHDALEYAREGLRSCTAAWMPETFLSALEMLPDSGGLDGLNEIKSAVRERYAELGGS